MDEVIRKKINILVHLAKIDGDFADTEKEVLYDISRKIGRKDHEIDDIINHPEPVGDMGKLSDYHRLEFMYLAIKLIRADGLIQDSEVEYCNSLADKLGIDHKVVDDYATRLELNFDDFLENAKKYLLAEYH